MSFIAKKSIGFFFGDLLYRKAQSSLLSYAGETMHVAIPVLSGKGNIYL